MWESILKGRKNILVKSTKKTRYMNLLFLPIRKLFIILMNFYIITAAANYLF